MVLPCHGYLIDMRFCQIRDVNSGTFGFVELALDKTTGQQVAIKFIDRGEKVRLSCCSLLALHEPVGWVVSALKSSRGFFCFDLVCCFPQLLIISLGRVVEKSQC